MDDNLISVTSTTHHGTGLKYLTSKFSLCSVHREVNKRGKGRGSDPRFRRGELAALQERLSATTGRKVNDIDLSLVDSYFEKFVLLVNLILERVYAQKERLTTLGEMLFSSRGKGYVLLRKEPYLSYKDNPEIREQCFERLYRNALEQAARIIQSNWVRRELIRTAIEHLSDATEDMARLLRNRYIPSQLIKKIRHSCEVTKDTGNAYHYVLSILKQLRRHLDQFILSEKGEPLGSRPSQRRRVRKYLTDEDDSEILLRNIEAQLEIWKDGGFTFTVPKMHSRTEDFSASTENYPGQGYWYSCDSERDNEILFFLKLPEPLEGPVHPDSPFRTRTLAFRFLDWFPRAAAGDRAKAEKAEAQGRNLHARKLRFRAKRFEDQHEQLLNTIRMHHVQYQIIKWKDRSNVDPEKLAQLKEKLQQLKRSRTCGPPRLSIHGHRVFLYIPFLPPTREMVKEALGERHYGRRAGADRGIRVPIVLSVNTGKEYVDELISLNRLVQKRDLLRNQTCCLASTVSQMRNNWQRKHGKDFPEPGPLRKKERHLTAIWRKIRRLDREIARQIASQAVWFCEKHSVKTLYLENLKNYQTPRGHGTLSWRLSTNLWSEILENIRYRRQSLGHPYGGIWTVSPAWTSRKCHVCGERGIRVGDKESTVERRSGEYFYCENCGKHFHADVNAARNIIEVDNIQPSADAGGTLDSYPSVSN
jgi:transposase